MVEKLYQEANAQPNPDQWLAQTVRNYQFGDEPITQTAFYQQTLLPILQQFFDQLVVDWKELATEASTSGFDNLAETLAGDLITVKDLQKSLTIATWNTKNATF